MKKYVLRSAILSIVLIFTFIFTACGSGDTETAVTVGSADVGSDVYAYFLDEVLKDSNESLKQKDAEKQAQELSVDYVRVNSEFKKLNLTLSSSAKAEIAAEVNDLWSIFGGYYESIGVSKQTLTNIKQSEAYREELISAIFGKGGKKEITEEQQKEYFLENYVFFKAVNAYLCTTDKDGNTVKLPANELSAIKEKFDSMKGQISADTSIDDVNKVYEEANGGSAESEMPVLSATKGSGDYPKAFFGDVISMEKNEVKVLTYDNYIFLIEKKDSSEYYSDYAKASLAAMAEEDFSKELIARYADLKISGNDGVQSSCYKLIQRTKGN